LNSSPPLKKNIRIAPPAVSVIKSKIFSAD
jgi:hypothetical protein